MEEKKGSVPDPTVKPEKRHYGLPKQTTAAAAPKKRSTTMTFTPNIPSNSQTATSTPRFSPIPSPSGTKGSSNHGGRGGSFNRGGPRPGAPPGLFARTSNQWVPVGSSAPVISDAMVTSQSQDDPAKRKPKSFKQSEIAPTAQSMAIDPLNLTHPLTLPFLDPVKANPKLVKVKSDTMEMDEVNPPTAKSDAAQLAESLFRNDSGEFIGEDQLFFIQMPSSIPLGNRTMPQESLELETLGFRSNLGSIPAGPIGKLLIYKSGKTKLKIGDVLFDVSAGMPCNFLQEIAVLQADSKVNKFYQIGEIARRMVCYPNIEDLLSNDSSSDFHNQNAS